MTEDDRVQPDRLRRIAASFVRLYPDEIRRRVSAEMNMTVEERANIDNVLDGEGASFRSGFFDALERAVAKHDDGGWSASLTTGRP